MEQSTAEEKIASIKQQFDSIDSFPDDAPAGNGSSNGASNGSENDGASSSKNELASSPAGDGEELIFAPEFKTGKIEAMKRQLSSKLEITTADEEAGGDGAASATEESQLLQQQQQQQQQQEGEFIAPEFEKGKVSAMKGKLVSEGHVAGGSNNGSFVAPELEEGKIKAMKTELSEKGLDLDPATAVVAIAAAAAAAEESASSNAPLDLDAVGDAVITEAESGALIPSIVGVATPAQTTAQASLDVPIPAAAEGGDTSVVVAAAIATNGNGSLPSRTDPEPGPAQASVKAPRRSSPLSTRRRPVSRDRDSAAQSRTRRASSNGDATRPGSSGRRTPSPAVTRKVENRPRGRQSTPNGPTAPTAYSSSGRGYAGSSALAARARRQSAEMSGVQGSRTEDTNPVSQRASSAVSSVSRAVVMSPGYATESTSGAGSEGGIAPHRRSSTPAEARGSLVAQQQIMTTPVRPVVMGVGSPLIMVTPSTSEKAGIRLHDQARETRERLERRRREGSSPAVSADGLSPFTPRRWSNPNRGNPSVAGMERVERLYRDATERDIKLEMARREEDENPRNCTFTPKITTRASSRGRSEKRAQQDAGIGSEGAKASSSMSRFHALYLDAKRRRAKMEALTDARIVEVAGPGTPVITDLGHKHSTEPLDTRLRENGERWARRWKELEEKKVEQDVEGCTFKPSFSVGRSASAPRLGGRSSSGNGSGSSDSLNDEPFVVRAQRYLAAKEERLSELKREMEKKELAEATFQPKVSASFAAEANGASPEHGDGHARTKGRGGDSRDSGVFERLLRAAVEQEKHKAALKEEFLQKERAEFHDFQPRLRPRRSESPARPLDARLRESTEHWVQSREAREQQRLQQLADQCTFRPSVGTGSDGGRPRRSSSAGPRSRSSAAGRSGGIGGAAGAAAAAAAAGAVAASYASTVAAGASGGCRRSTGGFGFEARSKAFQDAKEQRLNRLREEKVRHELKEATFTPIIGFGSGGSLRKRDAAAAVAAAAAAVVPVLGLGAVPGATAEGASAQAVDRSAAEKRASSVSSGDLGMAQKKEAPSKANDGPVSFKPQADGYPSAASPQRGVNPLVKPNSQRCAASKEPAAARIRSGVGQHEPSGRTKSGHGHGNGNGKGSRIDEENAAAAAAVAAKARVKEGIVEATGARQGATSTTIEVEVGDAKKKGDSGVDVKELSARLQQLAEGSCFSGTGTEPGGENEQEKTPPNIEDAFPAVTNPIHTKAQQPQQQEEKAQPKILKTTGDFPPSLPAAAAAAVLPEQIPSSSSPPLLSPIAAVRSLMSTPSEGAGDVVGRSGLVLGLEKVAQSGEPAKVVAKRQEEGEEEDVEADAKARQDDDDAQIQQQIRAAELDAAARASPGAEDSEAESVPEQLSVERILIEYEEGGYEGSSNDNQEDSDEAQEEAGDEEETGEGQEKEHDIVLEEDESNSVDDEDDDDEYYGHEDDDSDDEDYDYPNAAHSERLHDQATRSLEDFDQVQREIEAKLRAL